MKSINNQYGYWDNVYYKKTFTHPLNVKKFQALVDHESKILDIGCGYGRTCEQLYRLGYKSISGVDSSRKMIERGRNLYPHLDLLSSRSKKLPFESGSFDVVILFAVLTCIPTNEGQIGLIKEIHRILIPGGLIYVSDYWLQDNSRNEERYTNYAKKYQLYGVFELDDGVILRHHDRKWIETLLAGYETIACNDIEVVTMNGNAASAFQYLGKTRDYF